MSKKYEDETKRQHMRCESPRASSNHEDFTRLGESYSTSENEKSTGLLVKSLLHLFIAKLILIHFYQ